MDRLVITKLIGGLGNQMFQYAAGLALAKNCSAQLMIDTSSLNPGGNHTNHTIRDLELDVFNLTLSLIDREYLNRLRPLQLGTIVRLLRNVGILRSQLVEAYEVAFQSEDDFFKIQPPVILNGYWQNEQYFHSIREELLSAFTPRKQPSSKNMRLIEDMKAIKSASLHVRRGDYVTNAEANSFHGTCSVEYYHEAIQIMCSKFGVSQLFVFSDDVPWTKQNISFPVKTTFVDHNVGKESFWDMILMSECHHHIIANSSFSWWGAWLNASDHKQIIAPRNWFASGGGDRIVPEKWIKI